MTDAAKITLTKAEAKALVAFASKDLTRPQLCAIQFEPEHGVAVATDGYTLVRRTAQKTAGATFLVFASDLVAAAKHCGPKDVIEVTTETLRVGGVSVPVRKVDARFPPYREVLAAPRGKACAILGFDGHTLARLALVQDACGKGKKVRMTFAGELEPQSFDCEAPSFAARWDGVIMSCRV